MIVNKLSIKNSIFSRLVVIFFLIMVPIYILGFYNYYWGIQTVRQEISKSTVAQQLSYLEGLEREIESIKTLQYDCLNDENLNKLAVRWDVMDNYDRSESMRLLQQRLVTIKNNSNYISDVIVYILPIQRSISATTGVYQIDMKKYQNMKVPAGSVGAQIIYYQNGIYLSTMQENMPFTSLFLIEVELNKEAMRQALVQFNTYKGSGSFLIDQNSTAIVSDSNNLSLVGDIVRGLRNGNVNSMDSINIGGKEYYFVYNRSQYLDMALIRYIPAELILQPLKDFYLWVWLYSCVAVGIIIAYALSAYKYMHKPLQELVKSFHRVETGDFQVSIDHNSNDEFGYLYKRFNEMILNLNMLIKQVYEQKILTQRAELKHLQTQINPHFLYNSFFVLNTMALIGDENLIPFTKQLGEYFRFLTRNASDYIPLIDEIGHAQNYLSIQATRFSKRLQTSFLECPARFHSMKVPRLILQPILENAFVHGIERKKIDAFVRVAFEEDGDILNIIVEDNGNELTDSDIENLQRAIANVEREPEITGILNIHRRVQLSFGEGSGLQVMRSGLGGLKAVLRINTCGSATHD